MEQQYKTFNFRPHSVKLLKIINKIIAEYQAAGYVLTVRQLYYQLVARDFVENTLNSYKNVASLINDGRLAGEIDWDAIEDRTREFLTRSRWESGKELLTASAQQFHMDMWEGQDRRVFVIVEKEALVGVLDRTCRRYDVPLLAARGYPSASVMREFCDRVVLPSIDYGQSVLILHLGDHDPSGLDMTRDLTDRINMFTADADFELRRIALNRPQVDELKPPPNPAKTTDARFKEYRKKHGTSSWELDALQPDYIDKLVTKHIKKEIDDGPWQDRIAQIEQVKAKMLKVAQKF